MSLCCLPRSQTTIWKILHQAGCIEEHRRRKPKPLELRQPGEEVQFDLKDESLVPADPEGKRQHVVEIANFVDALPSIWLHRQVRSDFDAEALFEVVAQFFYQHGLPGMFTFDNDPRLVSSPSGQDFPSALVRFLWCVGVVPSADPAASPRQKCLCRTLSSLECLKNACRSIGQGHSRRSLSEPSCISPTTTASGQTRHAGSRNQPPRVACPAFPTLRSVPETVDPDSWLVQINQQAFARTIRADGKLTINHEDYYVSRSLAGQRVTCWVNAAQKQFDIWQPAGRIKSAPIKGLHGKPMPLQDYVALMKQEARSEYRQYLRAHPRLTQSCLWA